MTAFGAFLLREAYAGDGDTDSHTVTLTVDDIGEIDVAADVNLGNVVAGAAGAQPTMPAESTAGRLKYTSVVASGTLRTITAATVADPIPGLELKLHTSVGAGMGTGIDAGNAITLDNTQQTVVSAIGSCATDDVSAAELHYTVNTKADWSGLTSGAKTPSVTFTLTADQ